MPAKRGGYGGGSRGGAIGQNHPHAQFASVPDDKIYKFTKDEIVWAKMKFFSAWPAKVSIFFVNLR